MKRLQSALVTGATGFIGSVLVNRLLADQVEVVALVRSNSQSSHLLSRDGLRVIEAHTWDTPSLTEKLRNVRAEVIFHLASYGVQQDQRDPERLIEGNVGLIAQLLPVAANLPLQRFIHTGSCSEYGIPENDNQPISETQAARPTSLYGSAKASSVTFGNLLASQLQVPFVTLRLFGVYGPHESANRLMPYLIRRLMSNMAVDLTSGEQVRDLLFEEDVVNAYVVAATSDSIQDYDTYNVCSSVPTRIREVGEAIADALEKPRHLLRWGDRPYRRDEPMWLVGDNRKFGKITGWRPITSVRDGIGRMIDSARSEISTFAAEKHG